MILLSALLASLTGLVAGERPAERAQVEFSAVAAAAQPGEAEAPAQARIGGVLPGFAALLVAAVMILAIAQVRSLRTRLRLKQSWLL